MYNLVTGLYEGRGSIVPRSTRDNHVREDKRHAHNHNRRNTPPSRIDQNADAFLYPLGESTQTWITLIESEVECRSRLLVSSPFEAFVFLRSPELEGPYTEPCDAQLMRPNLGVYALHPGHRMNAAFLETENRFCELFSMLSTLNPTAEMQALKDNIHNELRRINRQKGMQWAQQRSRQTGDMVVVDTGELD